MNLTEAQLAHLILAFHEGSLTTEEKQQLEIYLLDHPDLAADLELLPVLSFTNDTYNGPSLVRSQLENLEVYQSEEGHPYDKLAIGSLEGLLLKEEEIIEAELTQDEVYLGFKKRVQQTQLIPNEQITFPNYDLLLKEAPFRVFSFKKYVYPLSAAAAILVAVLLVNQNASAPAILKPIQKGVASKKSVVQQSNDNNMALTSKPSPLKNAYQSVTNKQVEVSQEPRDCIIPLQKPAIIPELYAQNVIEHDPTHALSDPNSTAQQPWSTTEAQAQNNPSAFAKEPITIKAFLLQKTNEKLFGTAAPTTDLKLETFARYASQTVGIPVQYRVEEMTDSDKIVFQFGRFSLERNRAKK
jgi:hypothetical protein